jgi:hypothetical protein
VIGAHDIDPGTLAKRLHDAEFRRELAHAIEGEQGSLLPVTQAYEIAAAKTQATDAELRSIVELLGREEANEALIRALLVHPEMPEDILLGFCERGEHVDVLGHRGGPRSLLARIAQLHNYAEAILTLALDFYQDPDVPLAEFEAFVRSHATNEWMLRSLAEVEASSAEKEQTYEALLADFPDPAAYHALFLARSRAVERLAAFLDGHDDPWILELLLASDLEDEPKRALVEARASLHPSCESLERALSLHRARRRARADDLSDSTARELFAAGEPEVLFALAGNPAAPCDLLDALARCKDARLAGRIRGRAKASLARRKSAR